MSDNDSSQTPAAGDSLTRIREARDRRDRLAVQYQSKRVTFALAAAALGPLAVVLLATQVLAFPDGGSIATVLIASELAALAYALAIPFLGIGGAHEKWICERLRAELLRREEFLFRARVGPYLNTPESALGERVDERLLGIDNDINEPVPLLSLEDPTETWRNALEDARSASFLADIPNFSECVHTYLEQRVRDQGQWFTAKSAWQGKRARLLENGAKIVLTVALIVAAIHLGLLTVGRPHGSGTLHLVLIIIAVALPPIGAAFAGLLSIFGSHRLSRSYVHHAQAIERLEKLLRRLNLRLNELPSHPEELQFQFKRTVLEVEELLSNELRQFWFMMHPEAPKPC